MLSEGGDCKWKGGQAFMNGRGWTSNGYVIS